MSFWTSQKLEVELPALIDPYSIKQIDCNCYTLRVGDEYYVSPTDQTPDPKSVTIRKLSDNEAFTIPPGQFALLITEEIVRIPRDAMAFISMKAKIKFKGLINVSGFHVDPGYSGKLVFSVFNAAPGPVHLRRGQDCFLIWFAGLGVESAKHKTGGGVTSIPTEIVNAIPGELQSLEGLHRAISDSERRLSERINNLEPKQAMIVSGLSMVVALFIAILVCLIPMAINAMRPNKVPSGLSTQTLSPPYSDPSRLKKSCELAPACAAATSDANSNGASAATVSSQAARLREPVPIVSPVPQSTPGRDSKPVNLKKE
jgi:dCTP deaminase